MLKSLLLAVALTVAGCAYVQPQVDECAAYDTTVMRGYCYGSKEVAAARRAVATSLREGSITLEQAVQARDILNRADSALDMTEQYIMLRQDGDASGMLSTLRTILAELK